MTNPVATEHPTIMPSSVSSYLPVFGESVECAAGGCTGRRVDGFPVPNAIRANIFQSVVIKQICLTRGGGGTSHTLGW